MMGTSRLRQRFLVLAVVCTVAPLAPATGFAQSADRVRLLPKGEVQGEITSISPNDVEVSDPRKEEPVRVTIDQIRELLFAGEPDSLRSARAMLLRQDAASALAELEKVEEGELDGASENVLAEMDFVRAAAAARMAEATGEGVDAAEQALRAFIAKRPRSHHFYSAHETLGGLLARAGKYADAVAAYAVLAKGPPAFKVRAAAAKAEMLFEQKQYAAAQREFENAAGITTDPKDEASAAQKRYAALGAARCLVRQGKAADVVPAVRGLLAQASPDDRELLARAFNALGDAYAAQGGKDQDALIAYLTVDLVYNTVPDSHAEALFNLARLWQKTQNPERSRAAKQTLEASYPDSRWNRQLAAGAGG
jgi:tetratricopeptide (TPR) repeat protein